MISRIKEYTYDQEADAIYITFSDKRVASTRAHQILWLIDRLHSHAISPTPIGRSYPGCT